MNLITAIQLATIPAMLIIVASVLVQRHNLEEISAGRRWFFWLLGLSVGIQLFVFLSQLLSPQNGIQLGYFLAVASLPILLGMLALLVLDVGVWIGMPATQKVLALLAVALVVAASFLILQPYGLAFVLLAGAVILAMAWALNKLPRVFLAGLSLLVLLMLSLWTQITFNRGEALFLDAIRPVFKPLLFFLHVFGILLAAVLIYGVFQDAAEQPALKRWGRFSLEARSALALLLIGVLAYNIYWASLWDQTTDGVGGIFLAGATSISAIAAGMIMGVRTASKRRGVGGLFAVLIPVVLFGAFQLGISADYQALTTQRAARIQAALERYKTKNGAYPVDLQGLVPGELITVPQPVIYPGEGWCYQSGPNFYQLSTYYRRYFSTPFSLWVYAASGNPPGLDAACQSHLVELKRKYDPLDYPAP
jgi:hypothetical protein